MKLLVIALCSFLIVPAGVAAERPANVVQVAHPAAAPEALSAEELKQLEQRAEEPSREVVGGALSNLHLTYIVIALAAAVIVLVAK